MESPILQEAGDGRGLAQGSRGLAGTILVGFAGQGAQTGVSGLHRRSDWPAGDTKRYTPRIRTATATATATAMSALPQISATN